MQAFKNFLSAWFFYMIYMFAMIYVCYKFLTMKAKIFIVRKIAGKIFLWRHQFILFCFYSSACMLHQVLVILEAGKQLCIFWVHIRLGFMIVDPDILYTKCSPQRCFSLFTTIWYFHSTNP